MGFAVAQPILRDCTAGLTRIRNRPILPARDDRTCPAKGSLRPPRAQPGGLLRFRSLPFLTLIPRRAKREPQMRNCATENPEILWSANALHSSVLRIAPE